MKLLSKSLCEYLEASWIFLTTIVVITAITVFLRLHSAFPSSIQSLLTLGGIVFIGLAGWSAVRTSGFSLKKAAFVGLLLSFGTHWSVPIFHTAGEVLHLIFVNSIVFSLVAVLGGWLAKKLG